MPSFSALNTGAVVADGLESIRAGRASSVHRTAGTGGSHQTNMGRRGKSIGAAAKKSRRHLDTMQATRSKPRPVARGECLTLPVGDRVEINLNAIETRASDI